MEEEKKINLGKESGFQVDDWAIIKKFTYRERTRLTGKFLSLDLNNKPKINVGQLQFYSVVYGIKDASFLKGKTTTEDKLEFLENTTADLTLIFKEISLLNKLENLQVMLKK